MDLKISKLLFAVILIISFASCKDDATTDNELNGSARIEITDAPIDDASVKGSFVTITEVKLDGKSVEGFNTTTLDLMAYQNGDTKLLTDADVETKSYSEVTLVLDFEKDADGNEPGCYVEENDGTKHALVSSSNEVKSQKNFVIEASQQTNLVIDFDLRKSIKRQEDGGDNDRYDFVTQTELEAAVRTVEKDNSGQVEGKCTDNFSDSKKIVVYAYKKGEYNADTETKAQGSSQIEFAKAVSSASVDANGNFEIHFLEEGEYELKFIGYEDADNDGELEVKSSLEFSLLTGIDLDAVNVNANSSVSLDLLVTGFLPL